MTETKRRINSKAKGAGFEGHISKVLGESLAPMKFRRSQSSGAILGGVNAKFLEAYSNDVRALFVGDVVPTNEADVVAAEGWRLRFTVECKFYKDVDNLNHLFDNTKIIGWFKQATDDAAKVDKEPLLIFKFNRTETFCAVDADRTEVPGKISRMVTIEYNLDLDRKRMSIFLFKDALENREWFKKTP